MFEDGACVGVKSSPGPEAFTMQPIIIDCSLLLQNKNKPIIANTAELLLHFPREPPAFFSLYFLGCRV